MTRLRPVAVLHSLSLQRLHPDPFSSDGALQMTQQQLARNLGTTREGVARLIGEFVNALRTRRGALAPRSVWVAARGIAGPACEG
jgi:CRP-like cAMP-binding protein